MPKVAHAVQRNGRDTAKGLVLADIRPDTVARHYTEEKEDVVPYPFASPITVLGEKPVQRDGVEVHNAHVSGSGSRAVAGKRSLPFGNVVEYIGVNLRYAEWWVRRCLAL